MFVLLQKSNEFSNLKSHLCLLFIVSVQGIRFFQRVHFSGCNAKECSISSVAETRGRAPTFYQRGGLNDVASLCFLHQWCFYCEACWIRILNFYVISLHSELLHDGNAICITTRGNLYMVIGDWLSLLGRS